MGLCKLTGVTSHQRSKKKRSMADLEEVTDGAKETDAQQGLLLLAAASSSPQALANAGGTGDSVSSSALVSAPSSTAPAQPSMAPNLFRADLFQPSTNAFKPAPATFQFGTQVVEFLPDGNDDDLLPVFSSKQPASKRKDLRLTRR